MPLVCACIPEYGPIPHLHLSNRPTSPQRAPTIIPISHSEFIMKRLLPLLLVLLFLNCRVGGFQGVMPDNRVEVRFENHNWESARLYIMQGGFSRLAGSAYGASGRSVRMVRIPGTGTPVRFFVRFVASEGTWLSPDLPWVYQGSCLIVRLENNLTFSSVIPCE